MSKIKYSLTDVIISVKLFFFNRTNATEDVNHAEIKNDSVSYGILLALGSALHLVAGIFAVDCFNHTALRQITRIRIKFFQSMLRQEIGWYDVAGGNNNFAVRITE